MIAFEDLLHRLKGLDRRELTRWVENRWVLPERRKDSWVFHEVDVARVELIRHRLSIDRLIAAAIERGARARFQTL